MFNSLNKYFASISSIGSKGYVLEATWVWSMESMSGEKGDCGITPVLCFTEKSLELAQIENNS